MSIASGAVSFQAPVFLIALYGLAPAAPAIVLARPEATVAVPAERATVVMAFDRSGSMRATDVAPSRLSRCSRPPRASSTACRRG